MPDKQESVELREKKGLFLINLSDKILGAKLKIKKAWLFHPTLPILVSVTSIF